MSTAQSGMDWLLARDEEDPFAPVRVRRWKRHAKSVEALPEGWLGRRRKKQDGAGGIDPESRLRAANGVPEAMVKVASYGGGKASAVGQLDYISREGTLELEMSDGTILDGKEDIRDAIDHWSDEFHYRKGGARNTIHMVVSAPAGSAPEAVLQAGRQFAAGTFGDNHPYALVRHDDGDHPHVHIVARMRGDDGEMYRIAPGEFHDLRERFAGACRENGIEMNATPRQVRGASRPERQSLRKMREAGRPPRIDQRAEDLLAKECVPSRSAVIATEMRSAAFGAQATAHRELAGALEAMASSGEPDAPAFRDEAAKLHHLADYLDEGGSATRPDRLRETRKRTMTEPAEKGQGTALTDRPDAPSVLEKARSKAERGAKIAREIAQALPEGPDRDKAQQAVRAIDTANDRLHGRDPDRTMKADPRERSMEPGGGVSAPADPSQSRTVPVPGSADHARVEVERIRKAQKDRTSDKERDRDRD